MLLKWQCPPPARAGDFGLASLELKKKAATRQLLWQEYIEQSPDDGPAESAGAG